MQPKLRKIYVVRCCYLHCLHQSLVSDQTTGREHSPAHQQKIGLKITKHGPAHQNKTQLSPQSVSPIRKLPQASYPYLSEGRQNENQNHRKLIKLITWTTACLTQRNYESCHVEPPKMDGSWWRVLTKHGPLEKRMANHFSILALRYP